MPFLYVLKFSLQRHGVKKNFVRHKCHLTSYIVRPTYYLVHIYTHAQALPIFIGHRVIFQQHSDQFCSGF